MPKPFIPMTTSDFAEQLNRYRFARSITEVHMHHTWSPRQRDYRGEPTIEGMWKFHTQTNGWSDIAQHLSIAPDGTIWTGRSWNTTPASASGHNTGAFMFETIGNFDRQQEVMTSAQRAAVVEVIARVQLKCGLPPESLHFHREYSTKTCPGSGIEKADILGAVREVRERIQRVGRLFEGFASRGLDETAGRPGMEAPFGERERAAPAGPLLSRESEEGEIECGAPAGAAQTQGMAARGPALPAEVRDALRPHVINLTQGRFSESGTMSTTPGEVDAIFRQHLPQALEEARSRPERKLRLLFFAHGGLVSEEKGLRIAQDLIDWWKANHIYPIYFVWETGLWDTLSRLLRGQRELELTRARGLSDVSDRVLEEVARRAGGGKIWGGMKYGAERSVGRDGGALYVAQRLAEFCREHGDAVELHALGHSAGAIFHSYFVPKARELDVPSFRGVHFLAPAIRTDAFLERFEPLLGPGRGVDSLTLFTMRRDFEEGDQCGQVYRKSLLYLVSRALEPRRGQPLLGLEVSLRSDDTLQRLFGLDGGAGAPGEVVWAKTEAERGRHASRSTTHGGFDNDTATMESVLRRILDVGDQDSIVPFPEHARRAFDFADEETLEATAPGPETERPQSPDARPAPGGGRRRALCIGIDRYPAPNELGGCVNDARLWARTLEQMGYEKPTLLLDDDATRDGILRAIERLVAESRPGDALVLQYSGHGTRFRDKDGEEPDKYDEALVPVDMDRGGYILDEEQHEILQRLPEGVGLTCFFDCCHSGTNTRVLLNLLEGQSRALAGDGLRPRAIAPTPEMLAEYRRRRRTRAAAPPRDKQSLRWVSFAACQDEELALEEGGQGLFTRHAVPLLRNAVEQRMTNRDFLRRATDAFGAERPQTPNLDAADAALEWSVLAARGAPAPEPEPEPATVDIANLSHKAWDLLLGQLREMRPEEARALIGKAYEMLNGH